MPSDTADVADDLIDIGANLTHESFQHDFEAVLERSAEKGVRQILVTASNLDDSRQSLELAHQYNGRLFATAGVHPHLARQWNPQVHSAIAQLAADSQVVAVGETGLDFNRDYSPRPVQEQAFEAQLGMAVELGLPVFMHARDAGERFISILKHYRDQLQGAVVHCFTGSGNELYECLDLDLHVGITGWICDERRGLHLRELVKEIPLNRLMIETDAPYLLPRDLRPKPKTRRNEPMHLAHIAGVIAECRGVATKNLVLTVTQTTRKFFNLPVL